jgi:hypothetical protein
VFNRLTADELLAAASGAFRGDRAGAQSILAGLRERAVQRAKEAGSPTGPSMASRPTPAPRPLEAPPPPRPMTVRVDGYTATVSLRPAAARHDDLEVLRRAVAANERVAFDELAHHAAVIERLERETAALSAKVGAIDQRTDQALGGVVEGLGQFKREIGRVGAVADVAALKSAAQLQQVQGVVSSVQSAAYGEQGSVFNRNNLTLAANQLAWMFAGPALQRLGLVSTAQAQLLAAVAPLGSLVTGGLTLGRRQLVRFITGISTFPGNPRFVIETLRPKIADAEFAAFARRTDVPVTVTSLETKPFPGAGVVRNGFLLLITPDEGMFKGRVAWMVDTGANSG